MGRLNPVGVLENVRSGIGLFIYFRLVFPEGRFLRVFWWVGGDFDCKQMKGMQIHTLNMYENKIPYDSDERDHMISAKIVSYFRSC